ncbi:MAG: ACP S-malonyltransferase [Nitrospirota bacterium]
MMKVAFVFPGQGSQYVGMGKDLYEKFDIVKDLYKEASDALGYDIAELSFNGPQEELNKTFRTQPSLLTASYAAYSVLSSRGVTPAYVAGHSLGEYSAITASGVVSFRDAVVLTEKRGQFMQDAVPEGRGLMAAVLGLERDAIINVCNSVKSGYVAPANYNCPGQIVIAGEKEAVEEAMKLADDAGARKALSLAVSVPSHCRLMEPASKKLSALLETINLNAPLIPVVNNADAAFLDSADSIKESLVRQLNSPLLWEDSVRVMVEKGVEAFIEVGPKTVLNGLIKRIDRNVKLFNVEDTKGLEETLKALS